MMREKIGKRDDDFYITVGDVGVLGRRDPKKLISYSINLNPALLEVLNEIASIDIREERQRTIPGQKHLGTLNKRGLDSLSVEEVARLLSSDMFSVFQEAWRPHWFCGMDGDVLANITNESMVNGIWISTLGSAYAVKLLSLLHQLRSEGVSELLVKGPLETLTVDRVRELLLSPIFRGLTMDLSKALDGNQLSSWIAYPVRNQGGLHKFCSDPRFLERLRDVQSGRASLSPCRLPLLSLSKEEVAQLLKGEEFLYFSKVWGPYWGEDLDGWWLYETVKNEENVKAVRGHTLNIPLTKILTRIINGYYARGVPEERVRPMDGWPAHTVSGGGVGVGYDGHGDGESKGGDGDGESKGGNGESKGDGSGDGGGSRRDGNTGGGGGGGGNGSGGGGGERNVGMNEGGAGAGSSGEAVLKSSPTLKDKIRVDNTPLPLLIDDKHGRDHIGTTVFAEALANSIFEGDSLPLVIGLFAPWGAGKSFILEKVEMHLKYLCLKRNLEDIKKMLNDKLMNDARSELDLLKNNGPEELKRIFDWCDLLGGPQPTAASFDSQTYKISDSYLDDLGAASSSNLWFMFWTLGIVFSPFVAFARHIFCRDFIPPEYRLAEIDSAQQFWYRYLPLHPEGQEWSRRNLVCALWLYNVDKRRLSWNKRARNHAKEEINKHDYYFVFFNAWLYCGSDNLWAGLVKALRKAVEQRYGPSYAFAKYRAMLVLLVIGLLVSVGLLVGCVAFYIRMNDEFQELPPKTTLIVHTVGLALGSLLSLATGASAVYNYIMTPLSSSEEIEMTCSKTEVKKKLGFMAAVKEEMEDIGKIMSDPSISVPNMWMYLFSWLGLSDWVPKSFLSSPRLRPSNLVIFVDDLDRCPPDKVVQVLQALILLSEKSPFVFFLAVDPRIIVAAVESQDQGMYTTAGVNGYEYLDKIVQIPFTIPMMCDSEKANLARGYLGLSTIPQDNMLLWLDVHRATVDGQCYTRKEDNAVALKKKFVNTSKGNDGSYFSFSEALALLQDTHCAKTIFIVHSDELEKRDAEDVNGWDYFRRNGGRLVRQLDREMVGRAVGEASMITTCIMLERGNDYPGWEIKMAREMIVFDQLLRYEEILEVESYLSKQWIIKLKENLDDEVLVDSKRVDFLSTFDVKAQPDAVRCRLALLDQDRLIPQDASEDIDTYTWRKLEANLPADINLSEFTRLMGELNISSNVAEEMWEKHARDERTIPKNELISLLGLHPDLKAVNHQTMSTDDDTTDIPKPQ
eukprot:gene504-537_t